MKSREQMQDEIKAIYQRFSDVAASLPEADRESFGGTLAGLLMALLVVSVDDEVTAESAMRAVRSGVAAAKAQSQAKKATA
jgi:hypothetical protein